MPSSLTTLRELYYEASFYRLSCLRHDIERQVLETSQHGNEINPGRANIGAFGSSVHKHSGSPLSAGHRHGQTLGSTSHGGRGLPGPYGYATAPLPDRFGFTSDATQASHRLGTGAGMGGQGHPAWDTGDYFQAWDDVADYSR